MKQLLFILLLSSFLYFYGCTGNPAGSSEQPEYSEIYKRTGLLDSIVGTCSSFLVRTIPLDTLDFTGYSKLKISMVASTDGDLSSIQIYRIINDTVANIFYTEGLQGINSSGIVEINSPEDNAMYYLRMKLYASICTGQYYYLKVRNLNISGY